MEHRGRFWRWVEGSVDAAGEHLALRDADSETIIARVAPPSDGLFVVDFLVADDPLDAEAQRMLAAARDELDFYLLEVGGPNAWGYAIYHCGTTSNAYPPVHWSWYPGPEMAASVSEAS